LRAEYDRIAVRSEVAELGEARGVIDLHQLLIRRRPELHREQLRLQSEREARAVLDHVARSERAADARQEHAARRALLQHVDGLYLADVHADPEELLAELRFGVLLGPVVRRRAPRRPQRYLVPG